MQQTRGSILYITLEPCVHQGKTPPCASMIVEKGIKSVVIGIRDLNPLVCGKGIEYLKSQNIEVIEGILEQECFRINQDFFYAYRNNRAFFTIKIASTLDGQIALKNGISQWISTTNSLRLVHLLRFRSDAILLGYKSVLMDDPILNARFTFKTKNLLRVIIDPYGVLHSQIRLMNDGGKTLLVVHQNNLSKFHFQWEDEENHYLYSYQTQEVDFEILKRYLFIQHHICGVLVEGGAGIWTSILQQKMAEQVILFMNGSFLGFNYPMINELGIEDLKNRIQIQFHKFKIKQSDIIVLGDIKYRG